MIIRNLKADETDILKNFLYEAIFIPDGVKAPDKGNPGDPSKKHLGIYPVDDSCTADRFFCLPMFYRGKATASRYSFFSMPRKVFRLSL